jgi:hypothetical protein
VASESAWKVRIATSFKGLSALQGVHGAFQRLKINSEWAALVPNLVYENLADEMPVESECFILIHVAGRLVNSGYTGHH